MVLRSGRANPIVPSGVVSNVYGDSTVDPNSWAWEGGGIGQGYNGAPPGGANIGVQIATALDPTLTSMTSAAQEIANSIRSMAVSKEREARYNTSPGLALPGGQSPQEMFRQAAAIGAATAVQAVKTGLLANAPPLYTPIAPVAPPGHTAPSVATPDPLGQTIEYRTMEGQTVHLRPDEAPPRGAWRVRTHGTPAPPPRAPSMSMAEWDRLHPEGPEGGDPAGSTPVGRGSGDPGEGVYPDGSKAPDLDSPPGLFPNTFAGGRSFSLADLRRGAASRVNRWFSERSIASPPVRGPGGRWYRPGTDIAALDAGTITAEPLTETQRSVGNLKAALGERAKNALGSLAEGGGPGEALNAAAPMLGKVAGGVGIAYAAVNQGLDQMESQRKANQRFQQVLGGSNAEGFTERAQQNLFRLGLRGTMSGDEANKLYQGALDMSGGRGGKRTAIEGIGVGLYRDLGMSVQDTLTILQSATRGGNEALYSLAETLRDVTKHARAAGENAAEARENFEKAYAVTSQAFSGTSAVDIAQRQQEITTPLGAQAGDVSFKTDQGTIFQQAYAMGMTPNQYLAAVSAPTGRTAAGAPQGANVANQAQYALIKKYLLPQIGLGGRARMDAFLRDNKGRISKGTVFKLVSEMMNNGEIPQYPAVIDALKAGGVEVAGNSMDALVDIFTIFLQDPSQTADYAKQQEEAQQATTGLDLGLTDDQRDLVLGNRAATPGTLDPMDEAVKGQAAPGAIQDIAKRIGIKDAEDIKTIGDVTKRTTSKDRGDDDHKGVEDDLLQAIIANDTPSKVLELLVSKAHDNDHRFLITDPDGNRVQVNEHGLITQFFNQAESDPSSIQVIAGRGAGGSLSDLLNLSGYTNASRADQASKEVGKGSGDVGTGFAQQEKGTGVMKPPSQAEIDKNVTKAGGFSIELSAETRRYFNVVQRLVDPNSASRTAGVPPSSTPPADQLPSGQHP